jgi:hypothetical protein
MPTPTEPAVKRTLVFVDGQYFAIHDFAEE